MTTVQLFQHVHEYSLAQGFGGGLPSFDNVDHGDGLIYGTLLLDKKAGEWRDIAAKELGNPKPNDISAHFAATHDYAVRSGFASGLPTLHNTKSGKGIIYSAILLHTLAVVWRDVPAQDFGNPNASDITAHFVAANAYAVRSGFAAGFPTFQKGDHGKGLVHGTVLIRKGFVTKKHVSERTLTMRQTASSIRQRFLFASNITPSQREKLLAMHTVALSRIAFCPFLSLGEKIRLLASYRLRIIHYVSTNPRINGEVPFLGLPFIGINFNNLFPQGDNEIAQTLIHEMMHVSGYTHPQRKSSDKPEDGGEYYSSPPLQSEKCIAGRQSDLV